MKLFFGEVFPEVKMSSEEQSHILKVLRMRDGEEIYITDGKGNIAHGTLATDGRKVSMKVLNITENTPAFSPYLHIAIAPTKNIDRLEFFIEKATEMGIAEITILQTAQTERKIVNTEKLRKQSIAASKQSLRYHFPVINEMTKLSDFIKNIDPKSTFVAHCNENLARVPLPEIGGLEKITFLIGPEGDFSDKELQILAEKGVKAVTLGNQRLRTETAGILVAAWNYFKSGF